MAMSACGTWPATLGLPDQPIPHLPDIGPADVHGCQIAPGEDVLQMTTGGSGHAGTPVGTTMNLPAEPALAGQQRMEPVCLSAWAWLPA